MNGNISWLKDKRQQLKFSITSLDFFICENFQLEVEENDS
jgi:hypothetical protein